MPKFMYQASYTAEGLRGLLKDSASGRKAAVEAAVKAVGGTLESLYYCFGDHDAVLIVDLPDNVIAASVAVNVAASGLVKVKTTPLLTVAETDKALGGKVAYREPGTA
ncbi:MAG TPA: GYD domain-containing protein [Bryobacteraceae bacterium]|nr:GYD domain-containing protein [Bryobacteraceae bacterium]